MKKLLIQIVLLFSSLSIIGCGSGPGFEPVNLGANITDNRTGADAIVTSPSQPFKKYQVPYTISGNKEALSRVQEKIGTNLDELFSQSIQKVDTKILDANGNITHTSPKHIELDIELNEPFLNKLSASSELQSENGLLKSRGQLKTSNDSDYNYEYDITCLNENCANHEVLLFKVQSVTVGEENLPEEPKSAGVLVTESHPSLKFQRQKGYENRKYEDSNLENLIEATNNPKTEVTRRTVVVLNGRSYADVTVKKANHGKDEENKKDAEVIFSFQTNLTETNETAASIDNLFLKDEVIKDSDKDLKTENESTEKNLKAAFVGNNPDTGSFVVVLESNTVKKTKEPVESTETATTRNKINNEPTFKTVETPVRSEAVKVIIMEPDSEEVTEQSPPQEDKENMKVQYATGTSSDKKVFPLPEDLENYPNTKSVVERINKLHSPNRGHVKSIIEQLQSGSSEDKDPCGKSIKFNDKKRLLSFLSHTQYISPQLTQLAKKLDVTPKVMNLSFVESNFFNQHNSTDYLKTGNIVSSSGAVGPFQFLYNTALDQNSRIPERPYKIRKESISKRSTNPIDDRNFILPSAHMAYIYMRRLFSESNDPALAAFAYNRGEGNRNIDQNRALNHFGVSEEQQRLSRFDVTLDETLSYNMIKKSKQVCHAAYYAYTFIAMHFITENPSAYGFEIESVSDVTQNALHNALLGEHTKIPTEIADILPRQAKEELAQK